MCHIYGDSIRDPRSLPTARRVWLAQLGNHSTFAEISLPVGHSRTKSICGRVSATAIELTSSYRCCFRPWVVARDKEVAVTKTSSTPTRLFRSMETSAQQQE